MRSPLGIVAAVLALCVAAVYGWWFYPRAAGETPEQLAAAALQAPTAAERERAAVKLSQLGKPARAELVRVLGESHDAATRVACLRGLAEQWDYRSLPQMLDLLDDPSAAVRVQAGEAVQNLLRVNYEFSKVAGTADDGERAVVIERLRERWKEFQRSGTGRAFARQQMGEDLETTGDAGSK
jgi:hypothetical protein